MFDYHACALELLPREASQILLIWSGKTFGRGKMPTGSIEVQFVNMYQPIPITRANPSSIISRPFCCFYSLLKGKILSLKLDDMLKPMNSYSVPVKCNPQVLQIKQTIPINGKFRFMDCQQMSMLPDR